MNQPAKKISRHFRRDKDSIDFDKGSKRVSGNEESKSMRPDLILAKTGERFER